jgi:hypothetical protein
MTRAVGGLGGYCATTLATNLEGFGASSEPYRILLFAKLGTGR